MDDMTNADYHLRSALDQVLRRAVTKGIIDEEARVHLFEKLDSAIVEAQMEDGIRASAAEARDMLLAGCRSNGSWLGYEMMKAHDILKEAVGAAPDQRKGLGENRG